MTVAGVLGFGSAGRRHAGLLRARGCEVVVSDPDAASVAVAASDGYSAVPEAEGRGVPGGERLKRPASGMIIVYCWQSERGKRGLAEILCPQYTMIMPLASRHTCLQHYR